MLLVNITLKNVATGKIETNYFLVYLAEMASGREKRIFRIANFFPNSAFFLVQESKKYIYLDNKNHFKMFICIPR